MIKPLFSIFLFTILSFATSAAELDVRIKGIKDANGTIHVFVFTSADGFPKEDKAAVHSTLAGPHGNEAKLKIDVPDAGEYALMSFQDTDGDGKMSRFLGMIPQEPYALSRDPQTAGKPKFADSAIKAQDGVVELMLR